MNGDYPRSGRTVEASGVARLPGSLRAAARLPGPAVLFALAAVLALGACSGSAPGAAAGADSQGAAESPAPPPKRTAEAGPLVVFLGDSLTAGYGLSEDQSFPSILVKQLRAQGHSLRIVNAGVSGDTTAGGLERLDWILRQKPDVLVVGLGANDALRGQPLAGVEKNLVEIVRRGQEAGARVLLLGIKIPVNYGPAYGDEFSAIYPRVASETGAALVPFLLEGVGGRADLNLPDGIHPNPGGQEIVAANVLPHLLPLISP